MRPLILALSLSCVFLAAPRPADACSIADDRVEAPPVEHAYDAAEAPAAPEIRDAHISHNYEDGPGCMAASSCGDIHGLSLQVAVDADTDVVRIDIPGEEVFYARGWISTTDGAMQLFIPGYADAEQLDFEIQAIDSRGYPSAIVQVTAYGDGANNDAGCSSSQGQGSAILVLLASLVMVRRRRRSK